MLRHHHHHHNAGVHVQLILKLPRGEVVPRPTDPPCHDEIFSVIVSCCDVEPDKRLRPQIIIRNIRGLLTRGLTDHLSLHSLLTH